MSKTYNNYDRILEDVLDKVNHMRNKSESIVIGKYSKI